MWVVNRLDHNPSMRMRRWSTSSLSLKRLKNSQCDNFNRYLQGESCEMAFDSGHLSLNDVWGLRADPAVASVAATSKLL